MAAVVDQTGRVLGSASFAASTRGYVALVNWAERLGPVAKIGIEGTGTYGAGLARFARAYGLEVVEVDRPDRRTRRGLGKSDPIDAEAAARATLSGVASTTPKTREGHVEMIRVLRVARRGAMKARVAAGGQLRDLVYAAPEELRSQLRRSHTTKALVRACLALRPGPLRDPESATKAACGPWPGAGTTCRRNWTPWMSNSPSWSARPRQRCWPGPALAWTPPGSCW